MSEQDQTTGSQGDPDTAAAPGEPEAYDPAEDQDADPDSMNPRDLRGDGSQETDPDLDPDSMNPRDEQ